MADTVKPALKPTSSEPGHILERLEQFAADNPMESEYRITSELEAEQLLIAIAAVVKNNAEGIDDPKAAQKLRNIAHLYKQKVQRNQALEYLRELSDEVQLEIYGLKIVPTKLILN
jgi:hypothetical protein